MISDKILSLLKYDQSSSGQSLAASLGISRQALHKHVQNLRKRGFKIQGRPHTGYRLNEKPDVLIPERLTHGLHTRSFGRKTFYEDRTGSTQDVAKEIANQGGVEGTLILAEIQTRGRGRMGRSWKSGRGGIWASLILKPRLSPQKVPLITLTLSLAIRDAVEEFCRHPCRLKWPNDVMVMEGSGKYGKWKKICGILTETSSEADLVNWVVLGFGVNVNNRIPENLRGKATTLKVAVGKKFDRLALLQNILKKMEDSYALFLKEGFKSLKVRYLTMSLMRKGRPLTLLENGRKITGKFTALDSNGALIITSGGKQLRFFTGNLV